MPEIDSYNKRFKPESVARIPIYAIGAFLMCMVSAMGSAVLFVNGLFPLAVVVLPITIVAGAAGVVILKVNDFWFLVGAIIESFRESRARDNPLHEAP